MGREGPAKAGLPKKLQEMSLLLEKTNPEIKALLRDLKPKDPLIKKGFLKRV